MSCRVLVLGANGFLGSSLVPFLKNNDFQVFTAGRSDSNDFVIKSIHDQMEIHQTIQSVEPDKVINLIAETNVDKCEKDHTHAYSANVGVLKSLLPSWLMPKDENFFHLIHLSTDQLYEGLGPHNESYVAPVNIYAESKLESELIAKKMQATILRTNFVGRSLSKDRPSFTDWLIKSIRENNKLNLVKNVYFSPAHVNDVCAAILRILQNPKEGIFNFGSEGRISKAEFGGRLLKKLGLENELIKKVELSELKLLANRPHDMSMDSSLFEESFEYVCPTVDEVIEKCVLEYVNE